MKLITKAHADARRRAYQQVRADRDYYRTMLEDLARAVGTSPISIYLTPQQVRDIRSRPGTPAIYIPKSEHLKRAYRRAATALDLPVRGL